MTEKKCARCDRGYKIDLGLCVKCIEGCSLCSNNYTCDYCLSGYELDSQKQCIFTNNFNFDVDKYKQIKQKLNTEKHKRKYKNNNETDETFSNYDYKKKNKYYYIYYIVGMFLFFLIIFIICYLIKKAGRRQMNREVQNVSIRNNNVNISSNSERKIISEKVLEKEFYNFKKNINNSGNSKANECNICLNNNIQLANFKCGCSLKVCKKCYIKCKTMSNKCPGCRRII